MRRHVDREQQISGRSFPCRWTTLPAQANLRAVGDARRNLHLDPMHFAVGMLNSDFGLAALHGGLKGDFDLALNVSPAIFGAAAAAFTGLCTATKAAEEFREGVPAGCPFRAETVAKQL